MLHASELRKDLAQSKLEGFNKEAIKNSFQEAGTRLLAQLPGASKYVANSLKPSAELFLNKEFCSDRPEKTRSISRLSDSKAIPTCRFPTPTLPADEDFPLTGSMLFTFNSSCY
jgi:hypothetical protein